MDKGEKLNKFLFLLEKQEAQVIENCTLYKKKIDEEYRKYHLLKDCLVEYRTKLITKNEESISSVQYQQSQAFFFQLEKAIHQQTGVIERLKNIHLRFLKEYDIIKNKIKSTNKLIVKDLDKKLYHQTRKENQQVTDLFNQIKYMK